MAETLDKALLETERDASSTTETDLGLPPQAPSEQKPPDYIVDRNEYRSDQKAKFNEGAKRAEKILPWTGSALGSAAQSGQKITSQSGSILSSQNSAATSATFTEAKKHLERILQGSELHHCAHEYVMIPC